MFIWDFVADTVLGQIVDWIYGQVMGFLGNFFAEMGNMGVELFEMSWVQSVVLFFSYLAWALYGTNGMPDLGANQMYYSASVSGPIETMPDTPGLAVWHDGHIGVYIGDGYVIEAMNTKKGVVKTKLEGRGWTHWLEIEYINYD